MPLLDSETIFDAYGQRVNLYRFNEVTTIYCSFGEEEEIGLNLKNMIQLRDFLNESIRLLEQS